MESQVPPGATIAPQPVRPIPLYHAGQVGLSNGIPGTTWAHHSSPVRPIPLYHDRWDCPMESHVPFGPTTSHLSVPPTVPCKTGGNVQWNPRYHFTPSNRTVPLPEDQWNKFTVPHESIMRLPTCSYRG